MNTKPRITITRRLPRAVEAALRERFVVDQSPHDEKMAPEQLQRALGQSDGVLTTVSDKWTAEVLAAYPLRTRILANFGVGYDNIDLAAARAHEIVVTNTPDVLTDATADLTMTLMLSAMRRAGEGERLVRSGGWSGWTPTQMMGTQVSGKTLGLIGMGRIGSAVARRATRGFSMRVIAFSPRPLNPELLAQTGADQCSSLEQVLAESDVVSLHCRSTAETRGLMNRARLAQMKPGSFLINTARGDIVDDDALIEALISGHLGGAGLDVFRNEPALDRRYLGMDQVVLLPHLGSATRETRDAMGFRAMANLVAFFDGGPVPDRVA